MIDIVIIVLVTCIATGYFWLKQRQQFWRKRHIPYLEPDSLLYGNFRDAFNGKLSMPEIIQQLYNDLAPYKYGGVYMTFKPVLYVRDPELIKRILIKDFRHFADHSFDMVTERDPLSQHLFAMFGEEWSNLRHKLTPAFTASKVKVLFELMKECADKVEKIIEKSALDQETVDVKELMARYSTDVISSCAFGLEVNSLNNPNSEFRLNGKAVLTPTLRRRLYDFLLHTFPKLLWIVGHSAISQKVTYFFVNLVNDTIQYRERNGIVRNDFLNLLIELRKSETGNFDFNVAAQCFLFFIAGFETSSGALSFILYELAEHPDVQEKLQEEIDRVLAVHDGEISYDCLQEMRYMEKVFNETSRLFPALPFLQRICTEDYRFSDSDWLVTKGVMVFIPVQGLHSDPQYYPEPNTFNPENFSEEAKASRPPCTFLPFGDGPRNCIGSRFGLMQVKLALTTLLRQYTVTLSPQMKVPVTTKPGSIVTTSKEDILLNFNRRDK